VLFPGGSWASAREGSISRASLDTLNRLTQPPGPDSSHGYHPQVNDEAPPRPRFAGLTRAQRNALLLYVPFAVFVLLTFCMTTDDPFITLRYAANIVHGHGPVFNVGQQPVEGFSSPLDLLVVVVAYIIPGGYSLLMIKLASLLFGVLTLRSARSLVDGLDLPEWGRSLALFLTGASWTLAVASSNGLETTLTAWLTTTLVANLLTGRACRKPLAVGFIAAGVALTRPEGIGMVLVLAAVSLGVWTSYPRAIQRVAWALPAVGVTLLATVIRILYYKEPLANTYYAKHVPLSSALHTGTLYLNDLLLLNRDEVNAGAAARALLTLLGLALTGVFLVGLVAIIRRRTVLVIVAAAVLAQVVFILLVGGDWMWGGRFLAPVAPLIAVVDAFGVVAIVRRATRAARPPSKWIRILVIGIVSAATVIPIIALRDPVWDSHGHFDTASLFAASDGGGFPISVWLAGDRALSCARPGEVVTYSEVGYAGFTHLDVQFLDIRGLTDRTIARHTPPANRKYYGVVLDPSWQTSASRIGAEILRQHATSVLTFDLFRHRATVLGGAFTYVGSRVVAGQTLYLYIRAGTTCHAAGFTN